MVDGELLKCYGFTDEVWMKKSYSDDNGFHFELSINADSGWACLEQINEQGFSLEQVSKMGDVIDEFTKMVLKHSQIALMPFTSIEEVATFWKILTKQDLF